MAVAVAAVAVAAVAVAAVAVAAVAVAAVAAVAVAAVAAVAVAVAHLQLEHEDSFEDVSHVSKGDASLFGVEVLGEEVQAQLEDTCSPKGSLL